MAIPTDYASLQSWILDWINRPDLSATVPEFIKLAEGDMNSRLKIRHNETVTSALSLAISTNTVALPANYLELVSLNIADAIIDQPVKRDTAYVDAIRAHTNESAGRPRWFAVAASNTLTFDRSADQTYPLNIRYYQRWDVATDTTNWILTYKPAIYLGLCLKWASMYIKEANGMQVWLAEAMNEIDALITEDRRERAKGMTARVDNGLVGRSAWNFYTDTLTGYPQ